MAVKFQIKAPYVGPRPFERQHQALFFGRNREAHELVSLVIAHRAVLIYAPSGAGKTSLLNAGLLPLLEEERFETLPPARVQGVIPQDLSPDTIANIYVFNVLMSWAEPDADQAQLAQMSLVEFLAGREHLVDEIDLPQPRLIILDQFEELFTAYPERWPEREGFFRQVDDALAADPLLRVLFSVREDYLGQLDGYSAFLPERLQTRFRLPRLGRVAALAAIIQPLHGTGRSFAPGVAEKLVEELLQVRVETAAGATVVVEGEYVEPVQLQVVCQSLWQGLPPDTAVITSDHLQAFGDVNQALSQFYERSIKQTVQATGVREGDLRNWFEFSLITPAGTRGTVYRGAGQSGPIPHAAMDLLEDLHLIRGEWRAGARWYELTHDRFIEPIQQCNERWLEQRREAAQACERLEAQAAEWVRMGRGRGGLLDEVELRDAERWLPILAEADLGYSEDVPALVAMSRAAIEEAERERKARQQRELAQARALAAEQQRRAEEQAAAATRLRWLVLLLAAVLAGAVYATMEAFGQRREADIRRQEAIAAQATAVHAADIADEASRIAKQNEAAAIEAAAAARAERSRFEELSRIARAGDLAATSVNLLPTDPELSLTLALQAAEATYPADGTVRLEAANALHRALAASRARATLEHRYPYYGVAFSPDGGKIALSTEDGTVQITDRAGQKLVTLAAGSSDGSLASPIFSPDGALVVTGDMDGKVQVWDASTGTELRAYTAEAVVRVDISPDGKYVATGSQDGAIRIWPLTPLSGEDVEEPLLTLAGHSDTVWGVDFDPNCKVFPDVPNAPCAMYLASVGWDGLLKVWRMYEDASGGDRALVAEEVLSLNAHDDTPLIAVAFSRDGRFLATGSTDARVWEIAPKPESTGGELVATERYRLDNRGATVLSVAFSADRTRLVTSGYDGAVRVWSMQPRDESDGVSAGEEVLTFVGHNTSPVWAAGFSPSCTYTAPTGSTASSVEAEAEAPASDCQMSVVSAAIDGTAYIWDSTTGEVETALPGMMAAALAVAFRVYP